MTAVAKARSFPSLLRRPENPSGSSLVDDRQAVDGVSPASSDRRSPDAGHDLGQMIRPNDPASP
jgi:hypothetical protein